MGSHIRIVFVQAIYFITINRKINFIRLSELAHIQLEGEMGHHISSVFGATKFHVENTNVW